MIDTIGIDISKDALDAFWMSEGKHRQFSNNKSGLQSLIYWVNRAGTPLIVYEATGVYHRLLETSLAARNIAFAQVNPRQARRFAEGVGILAKTDRVDASMLAKMGSLLELDPNEPKSEILHALKEMLTGKRALIKDRTAAEARLSTASQQVLKLQISRRLRQISKDLEQIDDALETMIEADPNLGERVEILTSIPGIGNATAFALVIEMPELGTLNGKQAAALAGLAPMSRQSGKWKGRERIQGGRSSLRKAIYMPAVVATRFNPDMKAKYEQLIANGKCKKQAFTAIMRKLVVLANALIRDGRKWTDMRA
jgi:transposase